MNQKRAHYAPQIDRLLDSALSFYGRGELSRALAICGEICEKLPNCIDALDLWSVIELKSGNLNSALTLMNRGLAIEPTDQALLLNKGLVLGQLEQLEEALLTIDRLAKIAPNYVAAHYQKGNLLSRLGRRKEAIESFQQAIRLEPNHIKALVALSNHQQAAGDQKAALETTLSLLKIDPNSAAIWNSLGAIYLKLRQFEPGLESFSHAITLQPKDPNILYNRGTAYAHLNRYFEAIKDFESAVGFKPDHIQALFNCAIAHTALGKLDQALLCYDRVIELQPDFAEAYWNKSLLLLLQGNYEEGLPLYGWRWKREQAPKIKREFKKPLWLGKESLSGKTIFVHAEQGLGDTIQFCRYTKLLNARGAKVILECPKSLLDVLNSLAGDKTVITEGEEPPDYDYHCPILSLPLAFGTRVHTIPSEVRYLSSSKEKLSEWAAKLGAKKKPRIGICWSGNPRFSNDPNRSIPLQEVQNLVSPDFEWFSLQREIREEDVDIVLGDSQLRHFGAHLRDFSDTAAICDLMDLVISVDTSVAHLSAALGRPTWIALPYIPDWRWLLKDSSTPWYPTVTLFRQARQGDWNGVLNELKTNLTKTSLKLKNAPKGN